MRRSWIAGGLLLCACGSDPAAKEDAGSAGGGPEAGVDCGAFVLDGTGTDAQGATWTYESTDEGVGYALEGILFAPPGEGPFPGLVVNHGKGGTPQAYSANVAREFVSWGMVVIGTMLTHAPDDADVGHLPDGADGRSPENVQRAKKAYDLLSCLDVDLTRVAVHGHSMGAFVTGQLLGTHPDLFRAASHTAGGTSLGPNATDMAVAAQIVTPYQLHHGDMDTVVLLEYDQSLDAILEASGVDHELYVYPGYDHAQISDDRAMYDRVRAWYTTYGVLAP